MGVYLYLTNITKNENICLGKSYGLTIEDFNEYFNSKKWDYSDKFVVGNDNYEPPFYIRFRNNIWEFYYPPKEEEIFNKYTKDGTIIDKNNSEN